MKTLALVVVVGLMFLLGCSSTGTGRAAKLTALAAGEAADIVRPRDRLQQQLNIADMQIRHSWFQDARVNLATARKTIQSSDHDQLTDLDRIAGWVSISELSRVAGDFAGAAIACDGARKSLLAVQPEFERCEYVRGLAREFQALGDLRSAIDLLRQAGGWAKGFKEPTYRRKALVALAEDLFRWNEYEAGRDVLRHEDDAAWRAQTLLSMAGQEDQRQRENQWTKGMSVFGKEVDYKSNYQQSTLR